MRSFGLVGALAGALAGGCAVAPRLVPSDDWRIVRGPYLQRITPTGAVLRWRTSRPTDSRVVLGSAPEALDRAVIETEPALDHEVEVEGLVPGTTWFYAVGSSARLGAGGDGEHAFETAPPPGADAPVRVWVLGDSGKADASARAVRDAYVEASGGERTDVWLMLGDNAYYDGTDLQYQDAVFDTYPELLRTTALWPARGNHERSPRDYFGAFTLPERGEAGGVPSRSESYYSFDWANVHFVCLDSYQSDRSDSGPMYRWCSEDLASTSQDWIVAYWHHPPYSKGSHDSDDEGRMSEMRSIFLPLLESHGVDLVLCGHSHAYERSPLIAGHYGRSRSFDRERHVVDGGDGREDGDGAYRLAPGARRGAVYVVAGSGGQVDRGPFDHPAMPTAHAALGSLVLEIEGDRLDASFLDAGGAVRDRFTLLRVPAPARPRRDPASGPENRASRPLGWSSRCSPSS